MACPLAKKCPLYPELTVSLAVWRTIYCDHETKFFECARYLKTIQGVPVPNTLLPNGKDLARPDGSRGQ